MHGVVISLPCRACSARKIVKSRCRRLLECGADAYIGPLRSCEFAVGYRKTGAFCRADVGIGPYAVRTNSPKDFWFCCCMLQPPGASRQLPVSEQHQQCSADDSNKAGSRFFFVSFSWNTRHENRIVTRMLSLSMGATTLAGPSCRAL